MRRGLKHQMTQSPCPCFSKASNRSPMRRGLKQLTASRKTVGTIGFKPIPDEEGTETQQKDHLDYHRLMSFKPIPDEEGTETRSSRR